LEYIIFEALTVATELGLYQDASLHYYLKMDALLIKEKLEAIISEKIFICYYLFIYFADLSGLLLHLPPPMG
jgi:hypothetical protein